MADDRFCVIGAGAAGLGTMEVLQRHGIAFDCFEQSDRVGGHWHTDYESLHLITSRDLSGFAGYPMPSDYPVYPSRDQMRDYLERFATDTGVRAHVRFGVRVERVDADRRRRARRLARRDLRRRGAPLHRRPRRNGHLRDPNLPAYPGEFTGRQIHSGAYRSIDDIEGTRVLTVGAGNSGCDLAVDVANARLESTISIRRGQMFQPKAVFGRPRAEIGWLAKLPVRLNERIARAMSDVVIGPTRAYRGLPEPPTRNLNELPPVVNNLLPYWIHHGRIDVVPARSSASTASRVHFVDGTSREFDTILWATGFNVDAAVPRSGARPRARRRAAAHRRPDAAGRRREPVLHRPRGAARPAAARSTPRRPSWSRGCSRLDPAPPVRARRALRRDRRPGRADRHRARDLEPADARRRHKALDRAARPARVAR